jgi:hypothetical protein
MNSVYLLFDDKNVVGIELLIEIPH